MTRNAILFLSFPCVCTEPVLVKLYRFYLQMVGRLQNVPFSDLVWRPVFRFPALWWHVLRSAVRVRVPQPILTSAHPEIGNLCRQLRWSGPTAWRRRGLLQENGLFLGVFPNVCPEPVLVKWPFLHLKWLKKRRFSHLDEDIAWLQVKMANLARAAVQIPRE